MGTKKNPVRKIVDVHESSVIRADEIAKRNAEFRKAERKNKKITANDRKLIRKHSKAEVVKLHPLIVKFIKDNKLKCSDFIVEGPESIRLKEKWDV